MRLKIGLPTNCGISVGFPLKPAKKLGEKTNKQTQANLFFVHYVSHGQRCKIVRNVDAVLVWCHWLCWGRMSALGNSPT